MSTPRLRHDDFIGRVNYAEHCFRTHTTNSRPFDACFEHYDGAAVVTALVRRAQTDPALYAAIAKDWRDGFPKDWVHTAASYANWPTDDLPRLAHALRTAQGQGVTPQQLAIHLTPATDTAPPLFTPANPTIAIPSLTIPLADQATQTERPRMDQSPIPLLQPFETAQFFQPEYDQSLVTFEIDTTQWTHLEACRFGPARGGFDPRLPWSGNSFRYDLFERIQYKRLAIRRQHGGGTRWFVVHEYHHKEQASLLRLILSIDHEPTRWDMCHFLCDALDRTAYAAQVSERERWTQAILQKRVKVQRKRGHGTALIIPAETNNAEHLQHT